MARRRGRKISKRINSKRYRKTGGSSRRRLKGPITKRRIRQLLGFKG